MRGSFIEGVVRRIEINARSLYARGVVEVEDWNVGLAHGVKIERVNLAVPTDGIAHRCHKNLPYYLLVLKLYLSLYGVNVYVDVFGIYVEVDEVRNLLAIGQQPVVCRYHRLVEIRVPHVPAVDEEILVQAFLLCRLRLCHETAYLAYRSVGIDGQQLLV